MTWMTNIPHMPVTCGVTTDSVTQTKKFKTLHTPRQEFRVGRMELFSEQTEVSYASNQCR